jgi:hypothetical protein
MKQRSSIVTLGVILASLSFPCRAQQPMPTNAAGIPGRLSSDQMKAVLAEADEENRRVFSDLVQQTSAVPSALLSIQEGIRQKYPRMGGTDNCRGRTSELQRRLGHSLTPKQIDDIVEMNGVLMGCTGQYFEFAPPNSRNITASAYQAVADAKRRQEQIENGRTAILRVESALDASELSGANELFQGLAGASSLPPFAQSYLRQTEGLRQDLNTYSQAVAINRLQSDSLLNQLLKLSREVSLLHDYASGRPLAQAYLQHAIKDGIESSRRQLANLPDFQFNEASYRIPSGTSESDQLALIASRIKTIDESLAKVSEVRAIMAQPEAMKTIGEVVGGNEAAKLNATTAQIATADHVRASLVDAQNSVQAKIAAENEARERRIAAAKEAEAKAARAAKAKQQAEAQARVAARPAQGTANQASMTLEDQDAEDTPDKLAMTADAYGGHQYDAFTVVGIKITAARSVEGDHLAPPEAAATQLLGYKLALACMPKLDGQMVPDTFGKPTRAVCASYEDLGAGQISGIVAIYHRTITSGPMKGIQVMKVWITKDGKHFYGPYGVMAAEKPGNDN